MRTRRHMLAGVLAMPLLSITKRATAAHTAAPLHTTVPDVLQSLNIHTWQSGQQIMLDAPDVAENGALVPLEVSTTVAGVSRIVLLATGNPFPLLADVRIETGVLPWFEVRIKLAGSTHVEAYTEVAGHWYQTRRFVRVIAGGCGQG